MMFHDDPEENNAADFFFFVKTKMSRRSLLTVWYSRQPQGSELSSSMMIPQMTVVADLTRSEDWLSLKPGYAVGDCHARRLPSVHEAQRLWAEKKTKHS
jgi:hypothetical protein